MIDTDRVAQMLGHDKIETTLGRETTVKNWVYAVLTELNRTRALTMIDDCAALLDGSESARDYLEQPYPMADGEGVKLLKFWTPADLIELANLRQIMGATSVIPDPDGPEASEAKGRRAAEVLTRVAIGIDDMGGAVVGDVDWWDAEVRS